MNKCILWILIITLLFLSGCQTVTSGSSDASAASSSELAYDWCTEIDFSGYSSSDWTVPVVETESAFYYITVTGLYRYDKTSENSELLVEGDLNGISLNDGQIYYFTDDQVCRLDDSGAVCLWDLRNLPEEYTSAVYESITDFQWYEGTLYIKFGGTTVLFYDLKSQEISSLTGIHSLALCDGVCYFIDHAERTYSIYRVDPNTGEPDLVRGEGSTVDISASNVQLYDSVVSYHGNVYYTLRKTGDLYRYNPDGRDEMIADFSALETDITFLCYPGYEDLYFYTTQNGRFCLYKYDGQEITALPLPADNVTSHNFCVTDSMLFF